MLRSERESMLFLVMILDLFAGRFQGFTNPEP